MSLNNAVSAVSGRIQNDRNTPSMLVTNRMLVTGMEPTTVTIQGSNVITRSDVTEGRVPRPISAGPQITATTDITASDLLDNTFVVVAAPITVTMDEVPSGTVLRFLKETTGAVRFVGDIDGTFVVLNDPISTSTGTALGGPTNVTWTTASSNTGQVTGFLYTGSLWVGDPILRGTFTTF